MSERPSSAIVAAAVAALSSFANGCADNAVKPTAGASSKPSASSAAASSAQAAAPGEKKACCAAKNECKGLGGCKTGKNECSGKNECKGLGGCMHRDCK